MIPHLSTEDSETTTNDKETADVLWKFFESVFTMEEDGDNILPEFENIISESKHRSELLYELRKMKKDLHISDCWT